MIIYKITNTANGKIYIGQTIRSMEVRWKEHIRYLKSNIHKNLHIQAAWNLHGEEVWEIEKLATCQTQIELNTVELEYIELYNSNNRKFGYNIFIGGATGVMPLETRQRISNSKMGIKFSDISRQRMSKSHMGKKLTASHRKSISDNLLCREFTSITREKLSLASKGKPKSDLAKQNMAKAKLGKTRKPHSEETKQKMRDAAKSRRKNNI